MKSSGDQNKEKWDGKNKRKKKSERKEEKSEKRKKKSKKKKSKRERAIEVKNSVEEWNI